MSKLSTSYFLAAAISVGAAAASAAPDAGRPLSSVEFAAQAAKNDAGAVQHPGTATDPGGAAPALAASAMPEAVAPSTALAADPIPHAPPAPLQPPHTTSGEIAAPPGEHGHTATAHGAEAHHSAEPDDAAGPEAINWLDFSKKDKHGGKWPPLVALLIHFAVLVFAYVHFGKKPIAAGLQERRDAIAKDIENAAKILGEAEERAERYQAQLATKDADARDATQGLVRAGEAEKERIVAEAGAKAARLRKDAAFLMEQEVKQMQLDLVRDTVERAIAQAETLLAKGVTQADQERLAEEYLATLATQKASGAT